MDPNYGIKRSDFSGDDFVMLNFWMYKYLSNDIMLKPPLEKNPFQNQWNHENNPGSLMKYSVFLVGVLIMIY